MIPGVLLFHFQQIICLNLYFHSVVKIEIFWDVAPYWLINTVELGYNVMCRYKRALCNATGIILLLTVRN